MFNHTFQFDVYLMKTRRKQNKFQSFLFYKQFFYQKVCTLYPEVYPVEKKILMKLPQPYDTCITKEIILPRIRCQEVIQTRVFIFLNNHPNLLSKMSYQEILCNNEKLLRISAFWKRKIYFGGQTMYSKRRKKLKFELPCNFSLNPLSTFKFYYFAF